MKIVVLLAEGFEEIEAVSIIDVVRRSGIEVDIVGVSSIDVEGANKIVVKANRVLQDNEDIDSIDMVVLPGGWAGTHILSKDKKVQKLLKEMDNKGKNIGAICAAPFALKEAGVLKDAYTCYPSVEEQINKSGYTDSQKVVDDKNILTSRGPATAICFGLEIVKKLKDKESYEALKSGLLADFC